MRRPSFCGLPLTYCVIGGFDWDVIEQEPTRLALPELRVESASGDQFLVRALLDDATLVHHDEPVHRRDGRQPVRDGDDGLALHELVEVLLDGGFRLGIERRRRLVKDKYGRVLQ